MNNEIIVRKARADDESAALAILAEWNMAPVAASDEVPNPERSRLDIAKTFVAQANDSLVGVASYIHHSPSVAETASLAVSPTVKGSGVGFRLQCARLAQMKRLGVCTVRTETDRPDTIEWYVRKFGYRIVGTAPKKHAFSLLNVSKWTVLELDLAATRLDFAALAKVQLDDSGEAPCG